MEEVEKLECCSDANKLLYKLRKSEERAEIEGWIDSDELEKELGRC